ncbi:hypothetical protein QBZ16_002715 [Prototheca wickerhamii]|uniref:Uncharacterized protein n=1 Tax=Prototheca wickerhamii TaxID=3111 RepID=A0AAD9ILX0_PROWI|nr:hypothetical protein QBZ16_002715 [Prototheca wickerhamii]
MEDANVNDSREELATQLRIASLEAEVAGLSQQIAVDAKIQKLLKSRNEQLEARYREQKRASGQDFDKALGVADTKSALLSFQLSRSKIDIYRWRQRSALLKVRQSSAREDADRAERLCSISYGLSAVGASAAGMYRHAFRLGSGQAKVLTAQLAEARSAAELAEAALREQRSAGLRADERCRVAEEEAAAEKEQRLAAEGAARSAEARALAAEATLRELQAMSTDRSSRMATDLSAVKRELASRGAVEGLLTAESEKRAEAERRAGAAEARLRDAERRAAELEAKLSERERRVGALEKEAAELRRARAGPARSVASALELVDGFVESLTQEEGRGGPLEAGGGASQRPVAPLPAPLASNAGQRGAVPAAERAPEATALSEQAPPKAKAQGVRATKIAAPTSQRQEPAQPALATETARDLEAPAPPQQSVEPAAQPADPSPSKGVAKRRPSGRRAAGQAKVNLAALVWGEGESPAPEPASRPARPEPAPQAPAEVRPAAAAGAPAPAHPVEGRPRQPSATQQPHVVEAAKKLTTAPLAPSHPALDRPALVYVVFTYSLVTNVYWGDLLAKFCEVLLFDPERPFSHSIFLQMQADERAAAAWRLQAGAQAQAPRRVCGQRAARQRPLWRGLQDPPPGGQEMTDRPV